MFDRRANSALQRLLQVGHPPGAPRARAAWSGLTKPEPLHPLSLLQLTSPALHVLPGTRSGPVITRAYCTSLPTAVAASSLSGSAEALALPDSPWAASCLLTPGGAGGHWPRESHT